MTQYVQGIAGVAVARLVPFVVYAFLAHRRIGLTRVFGVVVALLPCALAARGSLVGLAMNAAWTLSYFGVAACLSHAAREPLASGKLGRATLFAAGFVIYLVVPALIAPPVLKAAAVVFGWELTLSAFSYSVESARQASTLGDALFFLLVNPVLVYPERGRPIVDGAGVWRGLGRIAVGLGAIASNYAMLVLLTMLVERGALSREPDLLRAGGAVRVSAYYAGQCLGLYFIHSGVASVQIGGMSILGWRIPERYDYPFLACSPAEFWRRWNTYIGSWVRRYLFFPMVTHLRRRTGLGRAFATAVSVLIAFGTMGFLHDWVPYLTRLPARTFMPAMTAVFLSHAAALLLFEGATLRIRTFLLTHRLSPGRFAGRAGVGVSWLTLRFVNQSLAWVAIPVLSRGELPALLMRLLRGVLPP